MKAIVFGSTGLVGSHLLQCLLEITSDIVAPVRKLPHAHEKQQVAVDFGNLATLDPLGPFDALFYCIGTTHKAAGSVEAFQKIELDVSSHAIAFAKRNRIERFYLLSSQGANASSAFSYMKTKGQIEENVKAAGFKTIGIFRPSLLLGTRSEIRFFEELAQRILRPATPSIQRTFPHYAPIHAEQVARAIKKAALSGFSGIKIFENQDLITLSD